MTYELRQLIFTCWDFVGYGIFLWIGAEVSLGFLRKVVIGRWKISKAKAKRMKWAGWVLTAWCIIALALAMWPWKLGAI